MFGESGLLASPRAHRPRTDTSVDGATLSFSWHTLVRPSVARACLLPSHGREPKDHRPGDALAHGDGGKPCGDGPHLLCARGGRQHGEGSSDSCVRDGFRVREDATLGAITSHQRRRSAAAGCVGFCDDGSKHPRRPASPRPARGDENSDEFPSTRRRALGAGLARSLVRSAGERCAEPWRERHPGERICDGKFVGPGASRVAMGFEGAMQSVPRELCPESSAARRRRTYGGPARVSCFDTDVDGVGRSPRHASPSVRNERARQHRRGAYGRRHGARIDRPGHDRALHAPSGAHRPPWKRRRRDAPGAASTRDVRTRRRRRWRTWRSVRVRCLADRIRRREPSLTAGASRRPNS